MAFCVVFCAFCAQLIHYVNKDGRVNAFYSTPTQYTKAKHDAGLTWTRKTDDFFPYADHPFAYWTGYFTSRPAIKGYVRMMSNYLQSARQILNMAGMPTAQGGPLERLWEAMSVLQHHDAVSGTEKQHVVCRQR